MLIYMVTVGEWLIELGLDIGKEHFKDQFNENHIRGLLSTFLKSQKK